MKKLFLFVLVLPFLFVSCGSDDDDVDYSADIVGTWYFSKVLDMGFETNNKQINKNIKEALKYVDWSEVDLGIDLSGYLKYSNNGNYESEGGGKFEKGTYTLNGKVLLHTPEGESTEKYTISIRNNIMEQRADLRDDALQRIVDMLSADDPEFAGMVNEMDGYGVKFTRITMSIELRK